jgi:uncharacterized membrane protein
MKLFYIVAGLALVIITSSSPGNAQEGLLLEDHIDTTPIPYYELQPITPPGEVIDGHPKEKSGLFLNNTGMVSGRHVIDNRILIFSSKNGVIHSSEDIDGVEIEWSSSPALNDAGDIAAFHRMGDGTYRLALWDNQLDEPLIQIPLPDNFEGGFVRGINNNGTVIGFYHTSEDLSLESRVSFQWDLAEGFNRLEGGRDFGIGFNSGKINEAGDIIGAGTALWNSDGIAIPIETGNINKEFEFIDNLDINFVNGRTVVVGSYWSENFGGNRVRLPFRLEDDDFKNLGLAPSTFNMIDDGAAAAVNSHGDVVGEYSFTIDPRFVRSPGFLWAKTIAYPEGELIDLGVPDSFNAKDNPHFSIIATDINDGSVIVGTFSHTIINNTNVNSGSFAHIWKNFKIHNLNKLKNRPTEWHLSRAYDINNAGQIIALAESRRTNKQQFFLLTPTDKNNAKYGLVVDGGFEEGGDSWSNWGDTEVIQTNSTNKVLEIRNQGRGQFLPDFEPSITYKYQSLSKRDNTDIVGTMGISFFTQDYSSLGDTKVGNVSSATYQKKSFYFTIPEQTRHVLAWAWKSAGTGSFFIDNISITPVIDKILNPDFEDSLFLWNLKHGQANHLSNIDRGAVLQIQSHDSWTWIDQVVSVISGKSYKLVATATADNLIRIGIKGSHLENTELKFTTSNWSQKELVVTIPNNETWTQVYIHGTGGMVDDIHLIELE